VEHKPKMIVAGYSAYSRVLDFARFRRIADKVGAYLMRTSRTSRAGGGGRAPSRCPMPIS